MAGIGIILPSDRPQLSYAGKQMGIALADFILETKPQSPPLVEYSTYTVKAGDSLSAIAARLLGDPMRWKEIFNINPDIADPNVIRIGQVIKIPAGAIASSTDPVKTTLPAPRVTAVTVADAPAVEGSFLNSPMFIVGAAGVGLLIIMMATARRTT